MERLAFCTLLLTLILHHVFCDQKEIRLETLPSDAETITCTGDLQCNSSDTLCILGDLEKTEFPVLIPTDIRAKTMKRCDGNGCQLCVQVTMDLSVAFVSEVSDEFSSGDCDDYEEEYYDEDYEEDLDDNNGDDETANDWSLYIGVNKPGNDSLLCANLFILRVVPASLLCSLVRVSLPQTSVPRRIGTNNSIKVGSVIYNTVNAIPGNELNITSYTFPKYTEELHVYHILPSCTELDSKENIEECAAPTFKKLEDSDSVYISMAKETPARNTTLRVFHNAKHKLNDTLNTLYGEDFYIVRKSDIVPCLCFEAWYNDRSDRVRRLYCPFSSDSDESILRKTELYVEIKDNTPFYELSAPCDVSAELSLCWNSGDNSECLEIPHTRKEIMNEQIGSVTLENLHPSLCLQVAVKGKVLHTQCLPVNGTKQKRSDGTVLVSRHEHENASFCFVGKDKCITLENLTDQVREADFLELNLVEDMISEKCMKILKLSKNHEVYACDVDKYIRSRWNWSRVLCLLVVACVLLILLLKNENLKKWLKSVTAEKSLSEIFNDRRVLILYSPDNQEYEDLVRVFASCLKDLQLDVVLDQWNRMKMTELNPLPWYHYQKDLVFQKKGLIILLFSEAAREKYNAWQANDATQRIDSDPYQSFGAVLNCVQSDFGNNKAKGQYVVATFHPSRSDSVPEPFNSVPVYELPLCLEKFLKEIAGFNAKKLGHKQVNRLSNKIRERLYSKDKLESMYGRGSVAVELQPLVSGKS
ncbi:interleukin-17 receptor C [Leptodactylus fuscus]|uniref:interleukin-17 receptor C n=1 Tax=Leptodactylus fuscus TaxID=238119 RepID=UPI003F4EB958